MVVSDLPVRAHLWYAGHGPRRLAFVLARLHPGVRSLSSVGDCWHLDTRRGSFYLSDPRQITRFVGIGTTMRGRVLQKYSSSEFVEVERGDTVVDVGAFIGEFSRPAGEIGDRVVAVEPDARNAAALRRNLSHLPESEVVEKAAWRETGEREFRVAGDPSEGSILEVDSDDVTDVISLETTRVDDLAAEVDLDGIDYLKIEAEGAEPEALQGVGGLEIPKIAVECAPERSGTAPVGAVTDWLQDRGYTVRQRETIVFGRL
jgi:FkbM family methyltransferase